VDLPGHGSSPSCERDDDSAFEQTLDGLEALFDDLKLPQVNLLGYSLGARIALGFALRSPERIRGLVLESGNAGLRRPEDRLARKQQDDALAAEIEALGIEAFVDRWETLPVLRGQRRLPPELADAVRARRLACSAHGLARALRGLGLGAQPNYWGLLDKLRVPTLAIVGAEDSKFVQIATEMLQRLPQGQVRVLANCGHSPHLERAMAYAQEVLSFLQAQSLQGRLEGRPEESV
jgi:2-succinyl-6-hydroxy-2,4-cyclohexadiene-1-carboxylate synthase